VTHDAPEVCASPSRGGAPLAARRRRGVPPRLSLVLAVFMLSMGPGCGRHDKPTAPPPDAVTPPKAGEPRAPTEAAADRQATSADLGTAEARGKEIYQKGISQSGGEISAVLGGSATAVPASVLACVNCHGQDGIGKPEGGIEPPAITWAELTKARGPSHPSGRPRPAYDQIGLGRAITMGRDAGGRAMDVAMPRYRLGHADLADLLAYLGRLGTERDPGISETALRVGVRLPPGRLPDLRRAVREPLTAYFDDVNRAGGLYGRRIELVFDESPDISGGGGGPQADLAGRRDVFAHVATFIAGAEVEAIEAVARSRVPLIGPLTLYPQTGFPLNRYVFYVYSGVDEQAAVLARFAAGRQPLPSRTAAILSSDEPQIARILPAVQQAFRDLKLELVDAPTLTTGAVDFRDVVGRLSSRGVAVVLILDAARRADEVLAAAEQADWHPIVLIPGPLAGRRLFEASPGFAGRIFLSFPVLPAAPQRDRPGLYGRLSERYRLPDGHKATQMEVLSAAAIFVEGLKRAGREVSRESLVERLEGLYEFTDGLDRPVTYGPNRRIGCPGSYVVGVDLRNKTLVPIGEWIEPGAEPR
jgi:ABC-type branched-subunit amino acid transport system substrate-binding protein